MKLIDLSHTVYSGLVTYKGLPAPLICDYLSRETSRANYEGGSEFQIGKIEMVTNTGTYIDCPFHRYADGKDLSEMELERFVDLPAIAIRIDPAQLAIASEAFKGFDLRGRAVLVHTNWSRHWDTSAYFENHPFITAGGAEYLRDQKVLLVGIESHNIDDTRTRNSRPVHSALLRAEIPIVEHLCNLDQLPDEGFTFSAVPPKFKGAGTFPVRAYGKVG
ncbi:MAG TPA: cyclase family protein [Steroidobacteraceae bacterium]|nr:cyclase family protein [Steroidobacteraceae bacterium]